MRQITKNLQLTVDGKEMDFRLTKLDAFSGVRLLRMLSGMPEGATVTDLFSGLSDADLRALMTVCLEHTEVRLPAGWIPVLTRGEWTYPELEYDTAACLKLTMEEAAWTLEGFFGEAGSASRPATQDA